MRRVPWELAALPALGVARLLPDTGWGLWARLAAATACLLLPGALLARLLRTPGFSAALAWSLGALFAATAVMFAVHASLALALILLAALTAGAASGALLWPRNRLLQGGSAAPAEGLQASNSLLQGIGVAAAGVGFGIALWFLTRHLAEIGRAHV